MGSTPTDPEPDAGQAYLLAYLTERDVVPTAIRRRHDGGYVVYARGRRIDVGEPEPGHVIVWALRAAAHVVEALEQRSVRD